jgi:RNA polymerase sigma factor (sigma-70 family)
VSIIYSKLGDSELTRLASKGDEFAFTELLERYKDYIFGACVKFTRNEHDGKDIFQKASLKAWKAFPRFRSDCHFKSWMYTIVRNLVYDYSAWKKRRGEISLEGSFFFSGSGDSGGASDCNVSNRSSSYYSALDEKGREVSSEVRLSRVFEETLEKTVAPDESLRKREALKELGLGLEKSLKRLNPEHRECLRCLSEGMSYEEISKLQHVPLGTVMSRVFYARKMAKKYCFRLQDFEV